jgi:type II secretory ATPase GspE/PulE/Tfp pilus assembly ATPase PilB-like protein
MADPSDLQTVEELSVITGYTIERVKASGTSISKAISKHFGSHVSRMLEDMDGGRSDPESTTGEEDSGELAPARLYELAREPSLVNLVNLILFEAIDLQASDIHIEPFEKNLKTRYRVDGVLVERAPTPKNLHPAIISRIKILAQMDIAERFVPQDGHIEFPSHKGKVDIRVSTIPTVFGESVVMRLLDRSSSIGSFEELGMDPVTLGNFNKCPRSQADFYARAEDHHDRRPGRIPTGWHCANAGQYPARLEFRQRAAAYPASRSGCGHGRGNP